MTHPQPDKNPAPGKHLHPELQLGPVALNTGDLDNSLAFYKQVFGLEVLERTATTATLGTGTKSLLVLSEILGAKPAPASAPGLYHFALLLPTRADLARWVKHAASLGLRLGQADHLVSEAFYLHDPDGHGIEVYRDRPRSAWRWRSGQVEMASDPIDMPGLLGEAGADAPFEGLPEGSVMGHIHLRVTDLAATESFYIDALGFEVVARWPGALFISVGGYHHHFGLNTWQSQGGSPAPHESAKLTRVNVQLPDDAAISALEQRLDGAGVTFSRDGGKLEVTDPSGNPLRFEAAR